MRRPPWVPTVGVGGLASPLGDQAFRDQDGYADLEAYAAIGDGRTIALVARDGRIDRLPLPDMDSPPAFAAVLDADHGGFLALRPKAPFTVARQHVSETDGPATTFTT